MAENKKQVAAKKETAQDMAVKTPKKRGPRGPRKPKEPAAGNRIHVGEIIVRKMKTRALTKNRLAKTLKLTPPTISLMVNSPSVQTDRLIEVSEALGYNFFHEIGQMLNISAPQKGAETVADARMNELQGQIGDMEREMRFMREENIYLRHIVELLAGQGKK